MRFSLKFLQNLFIYFNLYLEVSNATKTVKHKEQQINKGLQNSSMAKIRTNPGFHPISKGESFGGLAFVYARRNSAAARRPHQV